MASYEALRHVTIGRYIPTNSFIHRLDPRAKLISISMMIITVLIATFYVSNILLLGLIVSLVLLARIPLSYLLSSIRPALPAIIILSLLQLLFYRGEPNATLLLHWGQIRISATSLRLVIVSLLRFLDLLFLTSLLTNTTTTSALTNGLESLLRPFNALGLPGHEVALVGTVALRFVPILGEQLESIVKAQDARNVNGRTRSRWHLIHNTRRLANLVVPLFVDAYRRSEEMILAMQARCYHGGKGRTHLVELVFSSWDYVTIVLAMLLTVCTIIIQRCPLP